MLKINSMRVRTAFLAFILSCCIGIAVACEYLIPPVSKKDTLKLFQLNTEAEPNFYMTSQLTYVPGMYDDLNKNDLLWLLQTPNVSNLVSSNEALAKPLQSGLQEPSLYSNAHGAQEPSLYSNSHVTQEPSLHSNAHVAQEPSLHSNAHGAQEPSLHSNAYGAQEPSLHSNSHVTQEPSLCHASQVAIDLGKIDVTSREILDELSKLCDTTSHITFSLLPTPTMTDLEYLELCSNLHTSLTNYGTSNFSFIVYPITHKELSLYEKDFIDGIGTVLATDEDLKSFDLIYDSFYNKKPLIIRDEIVSTFISEEQKAISQINAIYYKLATHYPYVSMIYSPYMMPTKTYYDNYWLNREAEHFELFYTIYNKLLSENWITKYLEPLSNLSAFSPLESYDVLSGKVELILAPDSTLSKEYTEIIGSDSDYSILFKCNTETVVPLSYNPYKISLDTTQLPNDICRLKGMIQDTPEQVLTVESIDLTIQNNAQTARAPRLRRNYTTYSSHHTLNNTYIPILMYHTVDDDIAEEDFNSCVETSIFEAQMSGLLENGYTPINFYDLKQYVEGNVTLPEKPVIITMDDGYLNNYTKAFPIYQKYNIQATLFVSPYYMRKENTERHFGWNAAKEMESSGLIDIQSHGYNHTAFPHLSLKDLEYHISLSYGLIEKYLGPRDVLVVACPQFRNTPYTKKHLASLGIDFQITNLAKLGTVLTPPILKRINVPNTLSPEELIATLEKFTAQKSVQKRDGSDS